MLSFDPSELSHSERYAWMTGVVAPRPIALTSSVDKAGNVNLAPFSFFNMVSSSPPVLIFSPNRRGRDNTTKHTYENVLEVPEVVINIVSYDMVFQTSLSSVDFPKGVNEFVKAGFTPLASDIVKPPRVKESIAQFECKVQKVIPLGDTGGAGNLVICEIVKMHFSEEIVGTDGKIDHTKLDLVGRMGADWYARVTSESRFIVEKPIKTIGIGVDQIPADIQNSRILTGNQLGQLGNVEVLPDETEVNEYKLTTLSDVFMEFEDNAQQLEQRLHQIAADQLNKGHVQEAWKTLLSFNN